MVGLIQKLLLDLVGARAGEEAIVEICRRAGVPPAQRFRLDAVYADEEWRRLLAATGDVLGLTGDELLAAYADHFGRDALKRWPMWFEMSRNAREFLKRQPTIHNTFATGVSDPEARREIRDKFRLETHPHELVAHYRSPNELCGLYKALARWVLRHYGEDAEIDEPRCLKRGDPECEIHVRWQAPAPG